MAGAGAVGGYLGGCLALAGANVRLLGRAALIETLRTSGDLRISDFEGHDRPWRFSPGAWSADPTVLGEADVILVTVKSAATADMAALIAAHGAAQAVVVSLQNGVRAAQTLKAALPGRDVRAGVVPFNVARPEPNHWRRATQGAIAVEAGPAALADAFKADGFQLYEADRITATQYGKILLNLNNAVNALSGLPLLAELADPNWRRVLAAAQTEALAVYRAAGIKPLTAAGAPPWLMPHVLRLPTPLFHGVMARTLKIDAQARSSMADDLAQGRPTEIDDLQGEIVRLAQTAGVDAPVNARLVALVREQETKGPHAPSPSAAEIRAAVGA